MSHQVFFRDGDGIIGTGTVVDGKPVRRSYAAEWDKHLARGDIGAAGLRTVSKGSSRGAGPKVKQGRVRRRGGEAESLHLCKHGQRSVQCSSCPAWHCACPGSPEHVCAEAA